jgi:hypothetical protein
MAAPPFNLTCLLPNGKKFITTVSSDATLVDVYNAVALEFSNFLGRPMTTDNFRLVLSGAGISLEIKDRLLSEYKHYFSQNNVRLQVVLKQRASQPSPLNSAVERLNRASNTNLNRVSNVARNAALAARSLGVATKGGVSRKRKNRESQNTPQLDDLKREILSS